MPFMFLGDFARVGACIAGSVALWWVLSFAPPPWGIFIAACAMAIALLDYPNDIRNERFIDRPAWMIVSAVPGLAVIMTLSAIDVLAYSLSGSSASAVRAYDEVWQKWDDYSAIPTCGRGHPRSITEILLFSATIAAYAHYR
jgi:predicted PurR-regulated permease PerM